MGIWILDLVLAGCNHAIWGRGMGYGVGVGVWETWGREEGEGLKEVGLERRGRDGMDLNMLGEYLSIIKF